MRLALEYEIGCERKKSRRRRDSRQTQGTNKLSAYRARLHSHRSSLWLAKATGLHLHCRILVVRPIRRASGKDARGIRAAYLFLLCNRLRAREDRASPCCAAICAALPASARRSARGWLSLPRHIAGDAGAASKTLETPLIIAPSIKVTHFGTDKCCLWMKSGEEKRPDARARCLDAAPKES